MNSYDEFILNKVIYVSQFTILCNVDDLKISHLDSKVVDIIINMLDKKYGK